MSKRVRIDAIKKVINMEKYETFSTTADVGISIQGTGCEGLFKSAVKGLNLLLFGDQAASLDSAGSSNYRYEYQGDSPENILVNLLSEILFLQQSRGKITTDIIFDRLDENNIKAKLLIKDSNLEPGVEIKSVTYHNLKIHDRNGDKYAEVIFDI